MEMSEKCFKCHVLMFENKFLNNKLQSVRVDVRDHLNHIKKLTDNLTRICEDIENFNGYRDKSLETFLKAHNIKLKVTDRSNESSQPSSSSSTTTTMKNLSYEVLTGCPNDLEASTSSGYGRKRKVDSNNVAVTESTILITPQSSSSLKDNQSSHYKKLRARTSSSSSENSSVELKNDVNNFTEKRPGLRPRHPPSVYPSCQSTEEYEASNPPELQPPPPIPPHIDRTYLQQPDILINPNLGKVKLERDYNPIVAVKHEIVDIEVIDIDDDDDDNNKNQNNDQNSQVFSVKEEEMLVKQRREAVITKWLTNPVNRPRTSLSGEMLALAESSILQKIISFLDLPHLKTCRCVSKRWKFMSTKVILKRDLTLVKIWWDKETRCFRHWTGKAALQDLLKKPFDLPSSDVAFSGNGNLADPAVQIFFKMHGERIKTLELKFYSSTLNPVETPKNIFLSILNSQAPNVSKLTLVDCNYDNLWSDSNGFEEDQLLLPSLKQFAWKNADQTAYKILQAAPNLEVVTGFNLDRDLETFIQFNKVHTIQELVCTGQECPDTLLNFAGSEPKLKRLESAAADYSVRPQIAEAFHLLLDSNKYSIETLNLGQNWFMDGENIPKLSALKILEFGENPEQLCFPKGINLTETFPNLQTFDCTGLAGYQDANWGVYFPPDDQLGGDLGSVDCLKIGDCSEFWLNRLHNLCPNFKKLSVYSNGHLETTLPRIFRLWPHLESLELQAKSDQICSVTSLDPAITGLTDEACIRFRSSRYVGREQGFEVLKNGPSIANLRELKTLQIIFNYSVNSAPFPLSRVSGIYGFSLVKGLKVTIEIPRHISEIKIGLVKEMLAPYATVRPKVW